MRKLILASASPRRRELLAQAGFEFEVVPANVEEDKNPFGDPPEMVMRNASMKAHAVAGENPDAVVLGVDTTVALGGRVFNKPANLDEAREMLRTLGGKTHTVFTGVAILDAAHNVSEVRNYASAVRFKKLDDATISRYFAIVNPLDKAGAYGLQEGRELIVEAFDEPRSNIIGLPIEIIAPRLRELLSLPDEPFAKKNPRA